MPALDTDFPGTARFQVVRKLGTGGMGIVYQALDRERSLPCAIKTMRRLNADAILRFKQEFRALQDIQHQNLISLGELFEEEGQWFFTMELVQGTDFLTYVREGFTPRPDSTDTDGDADVSPSAETLIGADEGPAVHNPRPDSGPAFDEGRLRTSLSQLCAGIGALHAAGKVHRDIKPANIRVTEVGRVVLLDFGLVTDAKEGDGLSDAHVVGSTAYMAPEQAASRSVDGAADWYSVGVVLYQALTGLLPFSGSPLGILLKKQESDPPSPRQLSPDVPQDLDDLCRGLLHRDPKLRLSGTDVLGRLGQPVKIEDSLISSSLIQTSLFVGRADELAMLESAYGKTLEGRVRAVCVQGESGVGKSALVAHFVGRLARSVPTPVVLHGRCYERESLPYKAFDGVVDALTRHLRRMDSVDAAFLVGHEAALAARVFPVLRRIPAVRQASLPTRELPNPMEVRNRAFAALRGLFERLAERAPLIVCIDDFQWADPDSLTLLGELLHEPEAPALLLLVTLRTSSDTRPRLRRPEAELVQLLAHTTHLELGRLPDADARSLAHHLARQAAQGGSPRPLDEEGLCREAAGHPLFLHELANYASVVGAQLTTRVRLEDALFARIQRLEGGARRLLDALAVAGAPVPLGILAHAADLSPSDLVRSAALLRVAMLARSTGSRADDTVDTYHERIRDSVLANLDAETKRNLHESLAAALEASDLAAEDPHLLLRHLTAAGHTRLAAKQAERAARLAVEALAFDQAAELFRAALELGQPLAKERHALLVALGHALMNAGRCAEAAETFLSAIDGAEVTTRLKLQRLAAEQLLISGHIDRGLAAMKTVLAEVGVHLPSTPRRALYSLLWHRAVLRVRGLSFREKDRSQIPGEALQRMEIHQALVHGLNFVDFIRGADSQARGLLCALRTGEKRHVASALITEAGFRAAEGVHTQARVQRLMSEGKRIVDETGDPYLQAYLVGVSGAMTYILGHFAEAVATLNVAETLLREQTTGTTWEMNQVRVFRLFALMHMGCFRELGQRFDESLRDAAQRGDRWVLATVARESNAVWLARNDPARARRELLQKPWSPPETGFLHFQHYFELHAESDLALYEGTAAPLRSELAARYRAVSRSLLMRVQIVRAFFLWLSGRMALAEAEVATRPQPALADATRMARRLEQEGVPYASAWACLLRAGVAACEKNPARAVSFLQEAIPRCEQAGVLLCAAVARRRLGELCGGDDGAALIQQGDAWMTSETIVVPVQMSAVVAPGFR